jgi:hypothetical protein
MLGAGGREVGEGEGAEWETNLSEVREMDEKTQDDDDPGTKAATAQPKGH